MPFVGALLSLCLASLGWQSQVLAPTAVLYVGSAQPSDAVHRTLSDQTPQALQRKLSKERFVLVQKGEALIVIDRADPLLERLQNARHAYADLASLAMKGNEVTFGALKPATQEALLGSMPSALALTPNATILISPMISVGNTLGSLSIRAEHEVIHGHGKEPVPFRNSDGNASGRADVLSAINDRSYSRIVTLFYGPRRVAVKESPSAIELFDREFQNLKASADAAMDNLFMALCLSSTDPQAQQALNSKSFRELSESARRGLSGNVRRRFRELGFSSPEEAARCLEEGNSFDVRVGLNFKARNQNPSGQTSEAQHIYYKTTTKAPPP